jgi:hypothetical protein
MEVKIISPVSSAEYDETELTDITLNINGKKYSLKEHDDVNACYMCDLFCGNQMVNCIYCGFCCSGSVFKRK